MEALSASKRTLLGRLRSPRFRPREGLFLIEGIRCAQEALRASVPTQIRLGITSPRLSDTKLGSALRHELAEATFPVVDISDAELRSVSDTLSPQGVLLVAEEPHAADLSWSAGERLLLLDGVQDPGNAGTLIRAAWAFGLNRVVFLEETVDAWNPKVVRAAAGASFHLPVVRAPWQRAQAGLQAHGLPVLVADAAGRDVRTYAPPQAWALAVGNEVRGVRPILREVSRESLAVPMAAGVDSLNAGVAGAVLLFALLHPVHEEGDI